MIFKIFNIKNFNTKKFPSIAGEYNKKYDTSL